MERMLIDRYGTLINRQKAYRRQEHVMDRLLREYQIQLNVNSDLDYFAKEIIYHSLLIKRSLEDAFFDAYVAMYDYWYDLTYTQRKQQLRLSMQPLLDNIPYFMTAKQRIIMPCFDERFNHLYTDEIVLLDLKQYHVWIRHCADQIAVHRYGADGYKNALCSARVLAENTQFFVLYHAATQRLYMVRQDAFACAHMLALDAAQSYTDAFIQQLAVALLAEDEELLLTLILQQQAVDQRMQKRLWRYQQRSGKQAA